MVDLIRNNPATEAYRAAMSEYDRQRSADQQYGINRRVEEEARATQESRLSGVRADNERRVMDADIQRATMGDVITQAGQRTRLNDLRALQMENDAFYQSIEAFDQGDIATGMEIARRSGHEIPPEVAQNRLMIGVIKRLGEIGKELHPNSPLKQQQYMQNSIKGMVKQMEENQQGQAIPGADVLSDPTYPYMHPGQPVPDAVASGDTTAAEEKINRLAENFLRDGLARSYEEARNLAIGVADGRYKTSRDPITNEVQIVDMGQFASGQSGAQPQPAQPDINQRISQDSEDAQDQFGQAYSGAPNAFGVEGFVRGTINQAADAVGAGPVWEETQQAQSDFRLLRENLLNDIASAYDRQPPSWLLKEIRDLTPAAGSPFQGAQGAQSQLRAIGRQMQSELQATETALQRDQSPQNRIKLESRRDGVARALSRIGSALDAFGSQSGQVGQNRGVTSNGIEWSID